jgi:hypothetical protein
VSKYPSIIRTFPTWSVIGSTHTLSDLHTTLAVVALPVSSTSPCPVLLLAPCSWFQLLFPTTPAVSVAAIVVPLPTKLILITFPVPPPDPPVTVNVTVAV